MSLRRKLGVLVVAVAAPAAFFGGQAIAGGGTPANKVVAAASKRVEFGPGTDKTLMTATMRTSKPTDVMIHAALECTITQRLIINNDKPAGGAANTVRVWIEVDGKIVSLLQNSQPPQNGTTPPFGNDSDKVTFCNRTFQRSVTDGETPANGIDSEDTFLETKSAHAFNWIQMNLGSGIHTIAVKADLEENAEDGDTAEAEVGNRTLIVEPTKMANDAVIAENGTY